MAYTDYFKTVQEIYIAYYQRPADPEGLVFWSKMLDAENGDLRAIIDAFANSPEAKALYGDINDQNIADVVKAIYEAAFNREPEEAGLQYYVNGFKEGKFTPATIMLNILDGATGADKVVLENKIESAMNFTKAIDPNLDGKDLLATYDSNDIPAAREYLKEVTADPATVKDLAEAQLYVKEKIADPGDPILDIATANFMLTPNTDTIVGTNGDDTIKAPVVTNAAGAQVDTLNSTDVIDGKDGNDKLVVYTLGKSMVFPNMTNVEELELHNIGTTPTNYFMDEVKGLKTVDIAPTSQNISFYNLNNVVSVVDENRIASTLTIDYAPGAVSGTDDNQEITLKGAGNSSSMEYIKLQGGDIETVNISSEVSHNYLRLDTVGTDTIKVSGDADIDLLVNTDSGVTSYTVDASELKGNGVFDVATGVNATLKGGSGDDTFIVDGGSDDKNLTIDGNSGNDVMKVSVNYKDANYHDTKHLDSAISNVEKVEIGGSGITLNLSHQTEGFEIVDNNSANTIYASKGADTVELADDTAADKVVVEHPFAATDTVKDFDANAEDLLYIDVVRNNANKFGANNELPSGVVLPTSKKVKVLSVVGGTKLKQVTQTLGGGKKFTNATIGDGKTVKAVLMGKSILISNAVAGTDKFKIVTKSGIKNFSKVTGANKTALVVFYDTDDKKLELIELKWGATAGSKVTGGFSIVTKKTVANFSVTDVTKLDKADILLF